MKSIQITNQLVKIPSKIHVSIENSNLIFTGPLGKISLDLKKHDTLGECFFAIETNAPTGQLLNISTTQPKGKILLNSLTSLISQYFTGLSQGFLVTLECIGIGYKVQLVKNILQLKVGFSHGVDFIVPTDVQVFLPKANTICLFGIDKKRLYQIAAQLQSLKVPDSYKGKGLKLAHTKLSLKEGKKK